MPKFLLICFFLWYAVGLFGQGYIDYPKSGKHMWTRKEWRSANTARFSIYMSRQTRQSIRFMNLSRMYGDKFVIVYLDSIPEKNGYVLSLINTLERRKSAPPLRPSPNLWGAALSHAIISGITGTEGHQGFNARIFIFQPFSFGNMTGENCDYGARKGLDIALDLLIDEGVPSLGHRKNILDPEFARVGGARFLHRGYTWNAVYDYSSPKWVDFIFFRKPDITQWGLNLEFSQISDKPMVGLGAACFMNHIETTNMLADINYQYGLFGNSTQAVSGYLGYGSSTGMSANFLIGAKFSSYFPEPEFNLYIQPQISFFSVISFFRKGYIYETGDNKRSAIYRITYGYNFNVTGNRNPNVYRHCITISRFICIRSDAEKKKRKKK